MQIVPIDKLPLGLKLLLFAAFQTIADKFSSVRTIYT